MMWAVNKKLLTQALSITTSSVHDQPAPGLNPDKLPATYRVNLDKVHAFPGLVCASVPSEPGVLRFLPLIEKIPAPTPAAMAHPNAVASLTTGILTGNPGASGEFDSIISLLNLRLQRLTMKDEYSKNQQFAASYTLIQSPHFLPAHGTMSLCYIYPVNGQIDKRKAQRDTRF